MLVIAEPDHKYLNYLFIQTALHTGSEANQPLINHESGLSRCF